MKIAIFLLCVFNLFVDANAQSDSIPKPIEYQTYSPVLAGALSYIMPGLGQMYCGESDRGFKFLGYYGLAVGVTLTGAFVGIYEPTQRGHEITLLPVLITVAGLAASMGIGAYSIADAKEIAVRKNKTARQMRPQISFNYQPVQVVNGYANSISCSIRF